MRIVKTPVDYTGEPITCPECNGFLEYDYSYRANCRVCGNTAEAGNTEFDLGLTFVVKRVDPREEERQAILP